MTKSLFTSAVCLAITLLYVILWGLPGIGKLLAGGVPAWFSSTFSPTFLSTFPGLTISFYSIAILETVAAALALTSLLKGEWFKRKSLFFLQASLILSLFIFVQLLFGKALVREFDAIASLFSYFVGTLFVWFLTSAYFLAQNE